MTFGSSGVDTTTVVSDSSGTVLEILRDDIGLFRRHGRHGRHGVAARLVDIVEPDSIDKLADLLTASVTPGASTATEIGVRGEDGTTTLHFVAVRVVDRLVVVILDDHADTTHLTAEMLRISNEQLNTYRRHLRRVESVELSHEQLDDFTRLNNDLANLQRELAKSNRRLAASNAQKDEFLGMAAHELRSPLGVISNYAQFLDDEVELDDEHRQMMSTILRTIVTMRQLVDDLLDVATIEVGRLNLQLAEVDLADVVCEVAERQRPMAIRKSVRLELRHDDGLVVARADQAKLVQALDNLVVNAIKFSHRHAVVSVGASGTSDGSAVELTVSDHGIGIPDTIVPTLFTPFSVSRTGTEGELGTGLGLAIVKRIVEGHGGSMSVDSELERGTTVTVRIPR